MTTRLLYYNLFIKGPLELALNHVIIYLDLVKAQRLDKIVVSSRALLKVKKDKYNNLPDQLRSKALKKLEMEMEDSKKVIIDTNEKYVFLFKQLLHKTNQRYREKVVLDQCYNKLGHVQKGDVRMVPIKTRGLTKTSTTACI